MTIFSFLAEACTRLENRRETRERQALLLYEEVAITVMAWACMMVRDSIEKNTATIISRSLEISMITLQKYKC